MPDERPLYNSRIINTFVGLISKKYPQVDLDELLLYAGIKPSEFRDEGHWFTQTQIDRFHHGLSEQLGKDISREAGRYSGTGESLGLMNKYILGLIGPANAFLAIKNASSNFTRSSIYTSTRIAENKVEITVTPLEGIQERSFQCENRIGFFEAVLTLFHFDVPDIEHPECMFKGGACCRYVVTWKRTVYSRVKELRNRLTPALLLICGALYPWLGWRTASIMFCGVAFASLATSYLAERLEKKELYAALFNHKESSDNLIEQIGVNYDNARMVNEVGQAISRQGDIDEVLSNVAKVLEKRLRFDRCVILLADRQKSSLRFRTGFGYAEEQRPMLKESAFSLTDPDAAGVFVRCFREQRPIFVNDFAEVAVVHSARSVSLAEKMEAQSFICCPIFCEGESLGVLAVDNVKTRRKLVQSDLNLLMGIAPVIGMSIRNAMYIDRERRMSEQIRQSQKMEAVGQLAGGIAHDFNNLLTAIIGFLHLAQMKMLDEDPSHKYLKQCLAAAERASNLTQGLLAFSRKQINDPKPMDLNNCIADIKKLLLRLISAEVVLNLTVCDERLPVVADSGQIDQVMMNLVTNARDAMNGPGVLTIRTSRAEMTEDFVKAHGFGAVGPYALVSVSDTGMGMDTATKARIFEPFFTTKEVGKGTGLGLAIVYGIVQQHNGYLEIDSAPGRGTTFNIYLPILEKEVNSSRPADASEPCYRGTETVLVAEDAPEVRKLTTEVLKQNGYQVIEATDGQEALEKFSENRSKVDLVIMDVVMPKMNGKEVYAEIAKINPGMKVLFTSGYTPDDVRKKGVTFSKENFLAKPSSPRELLKKIRDMLAA